MKKDKRVRGIYKKVPDDIKIKVCKDHYDNHMSYQELKCRTKFHLLFIDKKMII